MAFEKVCQKNRFKRRGKGLLLVVFALYLLMALPVSGLFCASSGGIKSDAVIGLRMAGVRLDRYMSLSLRNNGVSINVMDAPGEAEKNLPPFVRRLRRLLFTAIRRAARVDRLDVQLRIGLDEAWSTALAAGGARAAVFSALGVLSAPKNANVQVIPDFFSPCFCVRLRCIFSVTVGDIMLKAAMSAMKRNEKGSRNAAASHSKSDGYVHGEHPGDGGRQYGHR